MSNQGRPNIEGTVRLDGLIEGHLGNHPDAEDMLRDWVSLVARERLVFSLEVTGDRFSLLADDTPFAAAMLKPEPGDRIADAIRDLARRLPPDASLFSTLRSIEFRAGEEVQTVYLVSPDRDVRTQERSVSAQTTRPQAPMTMKEKVQTIAFGLLFAAALFGISAIFIDYGAMFKKMGEQMRPLNAEMIDADASAFAGVFEITAKEKAEKARGLKLTVTPATGCPVGRAAWAAAIQRAEDVDRRLALEAVYRGYIRCEYFDAEGRYVTSTEVRALALMLGEPLELIVPVPSYYPVRSVRLAP